MKLYYLIILILVVFGCNQSTDPSPEPNIIWNLQVGNNWTFIDSIFTNNSIQVDSIYSEIVKQTTIDYQNEEINLSCLVEETINNKTVINNLFVNESEGLFHYGRLIESGDSVYYEISKNLLFKYPVEIGESWTYENDTVECIGKETDFLTPYGNFKCHVFKLMKEDEIIIYYCVPYVGIVGKITEYNDNSFRKRFLYYFNIG
ncbi:MAG: hypothetical protein H8D22_05550 [Candidatus Cloacimonetes bacterium]|nr:hypothetical protein [Candidatus Cloacimonadota bacterium]